MRIQRERDGPQSVACREAHVNRAHDGGFRCVDLATHVEANRSTVLVHAPVHVHVAVAKHSTARNVTRVCFRHHRFGTLSSLLALLFVAVRLNGEHQLVQGRRDFQLARVAVAPDRDARARQASHGVLRVHHLSTQARRFRDDEDIERTCLRGVQHVLEARPRFEARAADAVVSEHVRVVERPPLRGDRGTGVLNLARHRLGVLADTPLLVGLACVNGGAYRWEGECDRLWLYLLGLGCLALAAHRNPFPLAGALCGRTAAESLLRRAVRRPRQRVSIGCHGPPVAGLCASSRPYACLQSFSSRRRSFCCIASTISRPWTVNAA